MNSDTEKKSTKKITLWGVGGWKMEVDASILVETNIKRDDIYFQNISPEIMSKLIEYCKRHHAAAGEGEGIRAFDEAFVNVDENALVDLFMGALHLGIKSLMSLTRQALEGLRVKAEMTDPIPDPNRIKDREGETQEMICLKSVEGESFKVEKSIMFSSQRIKNIISKNQGVSKISTPIPSRLLVKAIEYCEVVATAGNGRAIVDLVTADARAIGTLAEDANIKSFAASLDKQTIECLMMASIEMEIESLFRLLRLIDFERAVGKIPAAAIPKLFPWWSPPTVNK